jgi:hypothetical protein
MTEAPVFAPIDDKLLKRDRWGRPMIEPPGGGKAVGYTRVSTLAKVLDDKTALMRWKQRQTALGLGLRPDLASMAAACEGDNRKLDEVVEQAMTAAQSEKAANIGTTLHLLTEMIDKGGEPNNLHGHMDDLRAYQDAMAPLRCWPVRSSSCAMRCKPPERSTGSSGCPMGARWSLTLRPASMNRATRTPRRFRYPSTRTATCTTPTRGARVCLLTWVSSRTPGYSFTCPPVRRGASCTCSTCRSAGSWRAPRSRFGTSSRPNRSPHIPRRRNPASPVPAQRKEHNMIEFATLSSDMATVRPVDVEGHLLVVEPLEFRQGVQTSMGESDAVVCRVHDITASTTYDDVMWFSRVLVGRLSKRIGQKVIGVMGKGDAKPGQTAPWIIVDASSEPKAVKAATDYLTGQVAASLASPSGKADDLAAALADLGATPVQ